MLRLEINALQHGRQLILETEEEIKVRELTDRIGSVLGDEEKGMLISCDKEGVLPFDETLSGLSVCSGELLLYLKGAG